MPAVDRRTLFGLAVVVLVLLGPMVPGFPDYWLTLLNNIGLASLVAIGLVLLTGVGGLTSFGQAAFCGFGAYTTAILTTRYGWSPWLTLPVALAVTGIAAVPLGLITVRLSGHYLPLGTIAWGLCLFYLFGRIDFLGGYDGIGRIPPFTIGSFEFFSPRSVFYLIWLWVILAAVLSRNLLDSRSGRAIRALRGGGPAAQSCGVDIWRAKLTVFVFAALLAGVSGWLYAHVQRAINPTPFGLDNGIEYLLMAVAGGAGHVWGGIFGAGLIVVIGELLQRLLPDMANFAGSLHVIVFGALLVLILQFARTGLWPMFLARLPGRAARPVAAVTVPLPRRTPPSGGTEVMKVVNVRKTFGGLVAVNDISFHLKAGEIVGLIGPNGAGKSTIFNLITGVMAADGGEIVFAGTPLRSLRPQVAARLGMARTFQHVKILPGMSVLENVALGAHLRSRVGVLRSLFRLDRREEARLLAVASAAIERVGLSADRDRPGGSLPLGRSRIVEIARALAADPTVLLLDEPAAGLRHIEKQELAQLLRKLRDDGMAILLVEHDMQFVMGLTSHIVVLDFGTKIAEGKPEEVRRNPAVIEAYLGGVA